MLAFKLSKSKHIDDLSGEGARRYGGRWNLKGYPLVYLGTTPSVVLLEYLVHIPLGAIPNNVSFAEINLPDDLLPELKMKHLPACWADYPFPEETAQIGTDWIVSKKSLCMKVPSAVSQEDCNILLNPLHPDISKVTIRNIKNYHLNSRLLRENL